MKRMVAHSRVYVALTAVLGYDEAESTIEVAVALPVDPLAKMECPILPTMIISDQAQSSAERGRPWSFR
jgi:hypothetical protein